MSFFAKKKTVITHSGPFHVDDVFAVAALDILLRGNYTLIRTRDPEIIKTGDIVLDVGGIYDEEKNRFDHHQEGGAGERNGIPYSSLGLIWKKFGAEICGSQEVADEITESFVYAEDALDCGVDIIPKNDFGIHVTRMHDIIKSFQPAWDDEKNFDEGFLEAKNFAKGYLARKIHHTKSRMKSKEKVLEAYEQTPDKRLVVVDKYYPDLAVLEQFSEPLFYIYPGEDGNAWYARAFRGEKDSFANRKDFPKAWAGKMDEELAEISGVTDAKFCHNAVWICAAKTKEGAMRLAQIAANA